MGKLSEKAKFIDMYASLPKLSFGKDGKVYSRLGLLLTFLTVVIIGGMAIWIGIKIFGRQTPSFIQYELPAKTENAKLRWSTDDFKFGLSFLRGSLEENAQIFEIHVNYASIEDNKLYPITTEKCSFDIFTDNEFYCFRQPQKSIGKTELDVRGFWDFSFVYTYCTDPAKNCKTQTEMEDESLYKIAILVYEDLLIDPFNYENPITTTRSYELEPIRPNVAINAIIELNEVEFISDNGWIFEDLKTVTKLKASIKEKVSPEKMLGIQIKYGGSKTVYKRTYPKIQDFFAQISGFITIITPIFLIMVSPYGNLQAIQHMTNEIYEIKLNKPDPSNSGDSPQKPAVAKKKRRSSKSRASSPTSVKETEGDLVVKKAKRRPPSSQKSIPFAPHAAFVIGGAGKLPAREETSAVADENKKSLRFDAFEKSPSKITPHEDFSNVTSPQKPLVEQANLCPPEDRKPENERMNDDLEAKQYAEKDIDEDLDSEEEGEEDVPLRTSDPLEVPWQAWLKSFWRPNPEVQILKKSKEHLDEAFDLVTLAKKVIEIDKMKACLFTHDQRVIFENLPSSVIVLNPDVDIRSPEAIKQYHWKDSFKGDEEALRKAYARLQGTKNELDQLLLRLYESEYIDDGAAL